jgi:hypothetical protein
MANSLERMGNLEAPMVKETRITFEVKDIRAFGVRCKKCTNEITLRLESDKGIPEECPMCKESRWLIGSGAPGFLQALRAVYAKDPQSGATVRLEIEAED